MKSYNINNILNGDKGFRGKYISLSNFYPLDKEIEVGYVKDLRTGEFLENSPTIKSSYVEVLFQAMKCKNLNDFIKFDGLTPKEAKRLGRKVKLRADWEDYKCLWMYSLIILKFKNCKKFKETLLSIKGKEIVEVNNWGDTYWGVDSKNLIGENKLGEILTKVKNNVENIQGL